MSKRGNDMLHAASGKCVLMGHLWCKILFCRLFKWCLIADIYWGAVGRHTSRISKQYSCDSLPVSHDVFDFQCCNVMFMGVLA
jgi:hypothetical protein